MGTMNDLFGGRNSPDPTLQGQQFGFQLSGFPEGNPHLNAETQKEAGIIRKRRFDEGDDDMPLDQYGHVATPSQLDEGTITSNELRQRGSDPFEKYQAAQDPQQRLFDIDTVPEAQPHEQTPDQWLKRDDVMFHTGPQPGQAFDAERSGTHFGTAEAGMKLYGSSKARDVVARRIPGVHDMPTAIDSGDAGWSIEDVQYENKVEDIGSVSAHVRPIDTRSWVEDQQSTGGKGRGRFNDYAHQLEMSAMYSQGQFPPDTSFRFRSWETNRASHARRGQELQEPRTHHQDFLASEESLSWGDINPPEWRHQWDKMKKWKTA